MESRNASIFVTVYPCSLGIKRPITSKRTYESREDDDKNKESEDPWIWIKRGKKDIKKRRNPIDPIS